MKASDFDCVVYDGAEYCVGCLPEGVTAESEGVSPIFATAEMDRYPVCDECGGEHDYVALTSDGRTWLAERHNMEIWQDNVHDYACKACGACGTMHAGAAAVPDNHVCGDCGADVSPVDTGETKWWFWCCSPGCLPEGDAQGPYDSYESALDDAIDGL